MKDIEDGEFISNYVEPNNTLKSGDLLFGPMGGFVPGFFPVGIGQWALFLTRRWWKHLKSLRRWRRMKHVGVVANGGTQLIQAMPKGCEIVPISTRGYESKYIFIRPFYRGAASLAQDVTGEIVAAHAAKYVGTPYNFLTYLKLAAGAFRMRLTERWLLKNMSTRADMMCSQHVDQSLADAGWHVFDDGRLPQDVVPAELFVGLLDMPGWFRVPGHPLYDGWTHNTRFPADGL